MTKERLEELIKQCATIWYGRCRWGCPIIKLDTVHFVIVNDRLYYQKNKKRIGDGWELKELREDVDRCKWEHKMFLSRTERFEPPMWEEVYSNGGYCFKTIIDYKVLCFITSLDTVEVKFQEDKECLILQKATKENYEKACEIVRDLFCEGGAKND